MKEFDLLVIGGGMAGASLACALRHLPLKVGIVEAVAPGAADQPSFDSRAIALSAGSRRIFDAIGVWQTMEAEGVTPIEHIHVSDRGSFGSARLHAAEEGVEALGYVVDAGVIGHAVQGLARSQDNVTWLSPARLTGLEITGDMALATVAQADGETTVRSRLVVAADGGRSTVRELLGGRVVQLGYGQTAVISHVRTDRPHGGFAYERFTDTGPLALLPCRARDGQWGDARWSLVWTVRDDQLDEILALDDAAFLERLQQRLGGRPGRLLEATPRHAYPLGLQYVRDHVRPRTVFIGNAAHAIHPVAGQGFNLGLRDVAALAEVLAAASAAGGDVGGPETLKAYDRWRRADHLKVMGLTDGLARVFSNRIGPLRTLRNLGMIGLDLLPPAKRLFARQTMGLNGRLPRLARGLPLAASPEDAA